MIKYVFYKNYSVDPCEHVHKGNLIQYVKWGMCLFIVIVIFFKMTKLIPNIFCDYLRSGGDIDDL